MSADHECLKNKDVKNAYGHPGDCHPFSQYCKSNLNSAREWTAITMVPIYNTDILTAHTFNICIRFLLGSFVSPLFWFRSSVSRLTEQTATHARSFQASLAAGKVNKYYVTWSPSTD